MHRKELDALHVDALLERKAAEENAIKAKIAAHPELAALEVNPLLARPDGCEALDARIVLADHADPRS